jgi:hypothetical protein
LRLPTFSLSERVDALETRKHGNFTNVLVTVGEAEMDKALAAQPPRVSPLKPCAAGMGEPLFKEDLPWQISKFVRAAASSSLWHRLVGRSASESGRLRDGAGTTAGGASVDYHDELLLVSSGRPVSPKGQHREGKQGQYPILGWHGLSSRITFVSGKRC